MKNTYLTTTHLVRRPHDDGIVSIVNRGIRNRSELAVKPHIQFVEQLSSGWDPCDH